MQYLEKALPHLIKTLKHHSLGHSMLNLPFIILSSSAIGEDVLKIYTLNYEFSDSAVREANPTVNSGHW